MPSLQECIYDGFSIVDILSIRFSSHYSGLISWALSYYRVK